MSVICPALPIIGAVGATVCAGAMHAPLMQTSGAVQVGEHVELSASTLLVPKNKNSPIEKIKTARYRFFVQICFTGNLKSFFYHENKNGHPTCETTIGIREDPFAFWSECPIPVRKQNK